MNPYYQQAYEQMLNQNGNQPQWLRALKAAQFTDFVACGFPTRTHEDWRYTDVAAIKQSSFSLAANKDAVISAQMKNYILPQYHNLVFINGYFAPQLSDAFPDASGVIATNVQTGLQQHAELIKPYFIQQSNQSQPFSQLNLALMTDGLFLYVPENIQLAKPIQLLHFTNNADIEQMHHLRHVIILAENAAAVLLENYVALTGQKYFNNIVTQINVNNHARLDYCKQQHEAKNAYHVANTHIKQHSQSRVRAYNFSTGGQLGRDDLIIDQEGSGAMSELYGLYSLQHQQHMDHHTQVNHHAAHGCSQQLYKGVLADNATAVFNGRVTVRQNAKSVNAQQTNQNLLLSKTASVNTKPALEIYASDVKCTHGATVGQIDDAALFYLRSRGLDKKTAMQLLVEAFMQEVLDKVPASLRREDLL